jgi:drug/metabolite transporter (DMT)-like permease
MLPLGYACAALAPAIRRGGLHVIYLGCFAMLVLVVSTFVAPAQADRPDRSLNTGAWQLGLGGACLALAIAARVLVEMDPLNFKLWLGFACLSFVGAMLLIFRSISERLALLFEVGTDEGSPHRDERNQ